MTTDEPAGESLPATDRARKVSWQVIAALTVVVIAIGVAITLGLVNKANPVSAGPLPMDTVGQPGADSAACKKLVPALPSALSGLKGRTLEGGGDGNAAWGDPAIILRCGMETPEELTCSSDPILVNDVLWLQLNTAGLDSTTYLAVDRSVRIAVTIPDTYASQTGPIQAISDVVAARLPSREPCVNNVLLPTDTK